MEFNTASGNETLGGFRLMHGMVHSILMDAELKKGVSAQSSESCLCCAEQQLRRSWWRGGSGCPGVVAPGPWHNSPACSSLRHLWFLSIPPQALRSPAAGAGSCRCLLRAVPALIPGRHPLPSSGYCRTLCAWKTGFFPTKSQHSNCYSREGLHDLPPKSSWVTCSEAQGLIFGVESGRLSL